MATRYSTCVGEVCVCVYVIFLSYCFLSTGVDDPRYVADLKKRKVSVIFLALKSQLPPVYKTICKGKPKQGYQNVLPTISILVLLSIRSIFQGS